MTTAKAGNILTNSFRKPGSSVWLLKPDYDGNRLPVTSSLLSVFRTVHELNEKGQILSAYTLGMGGIAEAVMKMGFGNGFGFAFDPAFSDDELFGYGYGGFVLELKDGAEAGRLLGCVTDDGHITRGGDSVFCRTLLSFYENKLESVFPCQPPVAPDRKAKTYSYLLDRPAAAPTPVVRPRVIIPVFPGTNCEYDTAKAFADAGALP